MTPNGCPLCGTSGHSCGQPWAGTPVDLPRTEARTMAGVKRYRVTVNGTDTIMKLSSDDAKKYPDAELVDTSTVETATAETSEKDSEPDTKARRSDNKSRTAANKSGARRGTTRNS